MSKTPVLKAPEKHVDKHAEREAEKAKEFEEQQAAKFEKDSHVGKGLPAAATPAHSPVSVGRIVHVDIPGKNGPVAAIVTSVHGGEQHLVALTAFVANEAPMTLPNVPWHGPVAADAAPGPTWRWPARV